MPGCTVILLAGASGSGKSRLATASGCPRRVSTNSSSSGSATPDRSSNPVQCRRQKPYEPFLRREPGVEVSDSSTRSR